MKKLCFSLFVTTALIMNASAQVAINSTGANAASSAMLDVSSSSKGVLLSRMTTVQRKAIANPEKGLLVFDTDRETIYFFDGTAWKSMMTSQQTTSMPLVSRQVQGSHPGSQFGKSVDIYENYAVVGAPYDSVPGILNAGAAYVFEKQNGNWKQVAKITAPIPANFDRFGESVSIYSDMLAIGAPYRTVAGSTYAGAIYIYKRTNNVWSFANILIANNPASGDRLGSSIAVTENFIIAGAPYRDHSNKTDAGSVYVFGLQNGYWAQKALLVSNNPSEEAWFGFSVDAWQSKLVVGAPKGLGTVNGVTGYKTGAAYVFNNTDANGYTWPLAQTIQNGYAHANMQFGYSVAMNANRLICGAPFYSGDPGVEHEYSVGAAFVLKLENNTWTSAGLGLVMADWNETSQTGASVALSDTDFFIGCPGWRGERGKVMVNRTGLCVYDDDVNINGKFGQAMAAYDGQFIIASTSGLGRVYFGLLD